MAIFRGSAVAIVTPFNKDGSIDFLTLEALINFQIQNNTDAIVVCGTTGEASTLTDDEQIEVVKFTVDVVKKRVPVIAGAGSNHTEHGINLCKRSEKAGVDALLIVTPYYNKTTQKGILKYYQDMAGSVNIPTIAYSVCSRTGLNIEPKTVKEIAKIENVVAIKEASGNLSQVAEIASLCNGEIDIFSGNDDQILPILSLGGKGVISVLANIAPKDTHDMIFEFFNGNVKKACDMQLKAIDVIKALFCEVNPIPVKAALNLMGFNTKYYRAPLLTMEEKNLNKLKDCMKNYGLI